MTSTIAPELKPDHTESEEWPTLGRAPTHTTHEKFDADSFDPTQGRKIGSDPYDDPTHARKTPAPNGSGSGGGTTSTKQTPTRPR
jgi:hypothetical protein